MFSLIISIIAIALVAALALASIYYGGSAFQEGSAEAEASTAVNQGQQVQAAVTMADVAEEWTATSVHGDLVTNDYLKEVPNLRGEGWEIVAAATEATVAVVNAEVCEKIEQQADGDHADGAALPAAVESQPFGCVEANLGTGTTGFTAYYVL